MLPMLLDIGASESATPMQDEGEEEGQYDADHVQSQVGTVHKVSAEAGDHDVDDQNDAVDDEHVVLLVERCQENGRKH